MKYLLFLVFGYGSLVVVMYGAQTYLVFPGTRLPSRPLDHPFTPERLVLETEDGVYLHGMLFAPRRVASEGLVIGFGGNAQDAEAFGQELAGRFPDRHVAVFHYRGYGPSTGRPAEAAMLADSLVIHDRLTDNLRPKTILALGVSLGSGVAAYLSKARALDGVLLVTPYDSIEAIAKAAYPWLPVGLLLKHRFPTVDFMRNNRTPVAIIASANDRVVAPARTAALRAAIPNLVFDRTIAGAGHADLYALPAYDDAVKAALDTLLAAADAATVPDRSATAHRTDNGPP